MPDDEILEPEPEDIDLLPALRSFDRQPKESDQAWEAFVTYRELRVDRSLAAVASELGKDKSLIERWSRKWNWVARVADYEVEQDRLDREAMRRLREEALRRHQSLAAHGINLVFQRIRGRGREGDEDYIPALDPADMTPGDVVRYADTFVRMDRMAFGEPTDLVRGAFMVTSHDFTRTIAAVVDVAMRYVPEDKAESFIRDVQAIGAVQ